MDIKQQALETARQFAYDFNDLMSKAREIEAYLLGTTSLTRIHPAEIIGDIVDEKTHSPVSIAAEPPRPNPFNPDSLPVALDDDATELLSLAKGLTSDLKELGYAEPDRDGYRSLDSWRARNEREKMRMKKLADAVEKCDISDAPPLEYPDICGEFAMDNYTVEVRDTPHGDSQRVKLRPMQLQVGQYMVNENMVVNVCRQFGTTTMIAAFARQQRMRGKKILILTNTQRNVEFMNELIDDVSVNVYSFADIENRVWAGESYDHIVIDNAAFVPYAYERKITEYVHQCHNKVCDGYYPDPTKVALISVPGQEAGWFWKQWTDEANDGVRKMAIDWKLSAMTAADAANLKKEVGEMIFGNQFENKFRPVT